ncbi:integrase [Mycobacterium intermedium]|uniref:Integrase n=1 Tax=Mycobacterium intermedium TaxID=28445 RepID=A0A1E3SDQ9_MYCIE|nr:site-specific integrase [Mycobacterium intermedium]MCV6963948.1 site-specific integrase [Mycobacterium intermedium]ODR00271.1 integrase [Mycobacterium intermedium]OPE51823.1 integrase [Mycobacterium intermedium]ORB07892.1 integrase [Mycobacterium intermedium]
MPRQRMAPGEHGRISVTQCGKGIFEARTYVRDSDGARRKVRRTGRSDEDARRALQRHLRQRTAPLTGQVISDTTTLTELFDVWITRKVSEDRLMPQSEAQYRKVWRVHGAGKLGALRIRELSTSRADAHLKSVQSVRQAQLLRIVLKGMFTLAVRFDVVAVNPIVEARPNRASKRVVRAATPEEFRRIRQAVAEYAGAAVRGPQRGRYLPAFVEVAMATGARPGEVLAIRWEDVDLLADPPTVTINGTIIDHQTIPGMPAHRQDVRKHGAPPLTTILPAHGVEALTELFGATGPAGLVFKNRDGGPMSACNLRRSMRAALPEDLRWCTPHSFRRTAGTVVRDAHGVEAAQQQLGHAHLATTEGHYVEKKAIGPDARKALDAFMDGESGR